ncbi:heavy-metal-associated domain-containing protein [Viridibacillus sp. YIM B01967]|uniref:Copper chaperone CopZ n=1 Tax=Viridibacillus soli TaxID=2798301 RepID=A0ABS1H646_9BACL|nr:copper ion binding protein [Viridibacillus soli]MBK3494523.1 heavy-metal-associated domain-containing protein [Viridibacillus soli]
MAETVQLKVDGMSCGHCVKAIETGVGALAGVGKVAVNLEQDLVKVDFDDATLDKTDISEAIEEAGYTVKGLVYPS